jgi:hypothetical protein
MKKISMLLICCFAISVASAQSKSENFQSDPKLVLEEVFRAANEQDYSNLSKLCPPNKSNDGDTQNICDIPSSSEEVKKEFVNYFKNARITGEVNYSSPSEGTETARIPFWFNHPGGESRSNETMNLVRIDGKWYLSSF